MLYDDEELTLENIKKEMNELIELQHEQEKRLNQIIEYNDDVVLHILEFLEAKKEYVDKELEIENKMVSFFCSSKGYNLTGKEITKDRNFIDSVNDIILSMYNTETKDRNDLFYACNMLQQMNENRSPLMLIDSQISLISNFIYRVDSCNKQYKIVSKLDELGDIFL